VRRALPLVECAPPLAGSSLSDEDAGELERLPQTIADRTRLRILNILIGPRGAPVCVCEFVPEFGLTQPTISYHLKQLREAGLLERERLGAFAYYRLVPGVLEGMEAPLAGPSLREAA
jgi:ArsR family transcriptional regulator, arsenate/arsenite/antimonite-responsive transcriptional repressor